jgi:hypothetical protein
MAMKQPLLAEGGDGQRGTTAEGGSEGIRP